jgi:hypothetical protein
MVRRAFTRREIAELAFEALGGAPRVKSVSAGLVRAMVPVVRFFHPRIGDLVEFAVEVSTHDGIAPVAGTRTLREYFADRARPAPAQLT